MEAQTSDRSHVSNFPAWVESVRDLNNSDFLQVLKNWDTWDYSRLDDLEPAIPLLNRIDDLLSLEASASNTDTLDLLLERTLLLLKNTTSKVLYSSVDRLIDVLDQADCKVLCKALTILQTLVVRVTQNIKLTKAHKNPQLCAKLYVIAMGANLNSAQHFSLSDLCTRQLDLREFTFKDEGEMKKYRLTNETLEDLQIKFPEKYHYFLRNRLRLINWSETNKKRESVVICQLLALSVLLQSTPDPIYLQDFCRSLPDLWLLPAVPELLRQPLLPRLHSELINDLTAILVMTEGQLLRNESTQNQVINLTYGLLALWQQHGLLQTLLRDLTSAAPSAVSVETARSPEFVKAVLYLSSVCADYKARSETAHIPGMTVSLLKMLELPKNSYPFRFSALSKAVRVLCVLVSQSIDMFKEAEGMQQIIALASYEMGQLAHDNRVPYSDLIGKQPNSFERSYFIRGLLRLIKISLSKWDLLPGLAATEVRKLVASELMDSIREIYQTRNFEIFEQSIQLLTTLINEQPSIVPDLIARGTLQALFQALETAVPSSPKLMAAIARVLCATSLHAEGAKLLEGFNTIAKLLQGLGNFEGATLTNDQAVDIAESLQDVLSRVPSFKEKAVDGSLSMLSTFHNAHHKSQEKFFTQLTNIGRLLTVLFNFSGDLFRLFIEKDGFELFLAILKLPVLPQTFNNEFHGVLHLFKSLQGNNHSSHILTKVLDTIKEQLQLLEEMTGNLTSIDDLSIVRPSTELRDLPLHDQLILVLTRIDSLVEMVRLLLGFAGVLGDATTLLAEVLERLGDLMRVLISEQARLSPMSKGSEKLAPMFNMAIDIKDIENPDVKTFEENFYFTCQLSIRKLFRLIIRPGQMRGRPPYPEETSEILARSMGLTLTRLAGQLSLNELTQSKAYYFSLLLSDIVKVLASDHCPGLIMLSFQSFGGLDQILRFLSQLKVKSFQMQREASLPFDLVNCLQILWNLSGKLLESLFQSKYMASRDPVSVYAKFGAKDLKEVQRKMHLLVITSLEELGQLECGQVSLAFARSVVEILRSAIDLMPADPAVESSVAQKLQDMGFPERNIKGALQQLGNRANLESATDYILKHGDVEPNEEDIDLCATKLSNLHILVANSLAYVPQLSGSLAELLFRIVQKSSRYIPEVLGCLFQQVRTELRSGEDCELLGAILHPLAYLSVRCEETVHYISKSNFPAELILLISQAGHLSPECKVKCQWLGHAFSILEAQVRFCGFSREQVMNAVVSLLASAADFDFSDEMLMTNLVQLLVTLTEHIGTAKQFVQSGRLSDLLKVRFQGETRNKQLLQAVSTLLLQLTESAHIFKTQIESALLQWVSEGKQPLKTLLEKFRPQISRNRLLFKSIFSNVCKVVHSAKGMEVEERKERDELVEEDWEIVTTLAQTLAEQHAREQEGHMDNLLQTDHLVVALSDVLQAFPSTIQHLLGNPGKGKASFVTFLLRDLIPFKYHLKLDSGKILFTFPGSGLSVTPQSYQAWVKAALKLLKVLTFKHSQQSNHQVLSANLLKSNQPILKARKKLIRELHSALSDSIKPGWFRDSKAVSIVRSCAIVIMQLLRETPKAPFASSNPAELAKALLSDKYTIVKHLCTAATGVDLNFKRAASVLNLLFAPLETLTRYGITFLLHSSKQHVVEQNDPVEEEVEVLDLEKYDFSGSESSHPLNASANISEEGEEGEEMSVDEEHSSIEEEDPAEEDIDEEREDSEEREDVEEEMTDDQEEDAVGDNLVIVETRNTEPFWADVDQEEDMNEFARDPWTRNIRQQWEPTLAQERQLVEPNAFVGMPEFDPENLHPQPIIVNHRGLDRRQVMDMDQMGLIRGDFENNSEEFIHVLFSRSRKEPPAKNPPKAPEENINSLIEELAEGMEEVSLPAPIELPKPPEPVQIFMPENIDPTFLEALPEDLRREVLVQQRPLHFLPPPYSPFGQEPRSGQEMDNASFVASLTPDLRHEVLATCPEEFLNSLPPELVAEARVLQDRTVHRAVPHVIERVPPPRRVEAEGGEVAELSMDEKLAGTLGRVDEDFLRLMLKALYLLTPVNREILGSLMLNITAHGENRKELLEALVTLLETTTPAADFPPSNLFGTETYLENYSQVFAIVTGRVLDLLHFLTKHNPKVCSQVFSAEQAQSPLFPQSSRHCSHFAKLVQLLKLDLFKTSPSHLNPLLALLQETLEKLKEEVPAVDRDVLMQLCEMLKYESLTDAGLKVAQGLISLVCGQSENKAIICQALSSEIKITADQLAEELRNMAMSPTGQLELQLLKLCKVLKQVTETCDFSMLSLLWPYLSAALNSLTEAESDIASTASPLLSKLLPVIETFFISHEDKVSDEIFKLFCDKNKKVLNLVVRQNPSLLDDTLNSLITRFHNLLDFENKRNYFKSELRRQRPDRYYDTVRLHVRRTDVFEDSFHQLKNRSAQELLGKLRVQFMGEEGIDAGGVAREWYSLLAKEMFNPNYALFVLAANGVSFQPNPLSAINAEHLQYFKFVGRTIGKALFDGMTLDVYFTRSFYKHILGQEVAYLDMEDMDPDFFKSLNQLLSLNLDSSELQEYYFVYTEERFGIISYHELKPGGKDIRVTESTKMDYIKLLCHMKMTESIKAQINAFLEGFHEVIPQKLVSIFDAKELELLVAGLPEVDLVDLRANTEYHNYTPDSPVIRWFWEVMEYFSQEERAEFIQFVTGSSKVPLEGFKALQGIGGVQKFQIHKSFTTPDRLPTAHTCMNQLDLPEYPSQAILHERLKLAISEGKEGFGFA